MKVLVTGGAGYIGSTIVTALDYAGHKPVILDSLITGQKAFTVEYPCYYGDIADSKLVATLCTKEGIEAVIHCAALIVVPESVTHPHRYYTENCVKSLQFFTTLKDVGVSTIIFSSSASIYAHTSALQVTEESALNPMSPYARSKVVMEYMLADLCNAWNIRYPVLRWCFVDLEWHPKNMPTNYADRKAGTFDFIMQASQKKSELLLKTGS